MTTAPTLMVVSGPGVKRVRGREGDQRRRKVVLLAATLVGTTVAAGVGLVLQEGGRQWVSARLSGLAQGVSPAEVGGIAVFVVQAADRVDAFVASAPGPPDGPRGGPLWWCEDEQIFFAPGELTVFERDGSWMAGPMARDLDQVPARDDDGSVVIEAGPLRRGRSHVEDIGRRTSLDPKVASVLGALAARGSLRAEQAKGFCPLPVRARTAAALPISVGPWPGRPWTRADGTVVPPTEVSAFDGPSHCGWDMATYLNLGWPLGTLARSVTESHTYIRDPEGVIAFRPEIAAGFRADVVLPSDAFDSGYRSGEFELWVSPSQAERWVYVRSPSGAERWPRAQDVLCM